MSWFLAALGVFVRDLGQIIGLRADALVLRDADLLSGEQRCRKLLPLMLSKNPIYVLVRGYRAIFLENQAPAFGPLWKLWLLSAVVFVLGPRLVLQAAEIVRRHDLTACGDCCINSPTLLVAYGPWGVLLLALIDSMGVPLPAAMDVLVLGVAAGSAHEPSHAYFDGAHGGGGVARSGISSCFRRRATGGRLFRHGGAAGPVSGSASSEWFRRYGLLTVFVPAVTPIVPLPLKVFVISAGALRTSFGKFLAVIVVARVIRYFGLAYLGLQLGEDAARLPAAQRLDFRGGGPARGRGRIPGAAPLRNAAKRSGRTATIE